MAIPVSIPRLGWNMDEGIFVAWLKSDGAEVRAGDRIFSLESEKATEEIECLDSGILPISPLGPKAGDKLKVGAVIGYLVSPGEQAPFGEGDVVMASSFMSERVAAQEKMNVPNIPLRSMGKTPRRLAISPRARKLAKTLGIDWTILSGSGRTGRIRERDVRAAGSSQLGKAVPITPLRKAIADRLLRSVQATVPVTLTTTGDATNLVQLRQRLANEKVSFSLTDCFVKLAAVALQQHPLLGTRWHEDRLLLPEGWHIGMAVDTEAGLVVPVIRDVLNLTISQLAERSRDLIARARAGKLTREEMQGGVFTVSNLGMFGIDAFTPIINYPECAILGIGRLQRQPVFVADQLEARDMVTLSLTFDHRVVDGVPAARFLQTLTQLLTVPESWLEG